MTGVALASRMLVTTAALPLLFLSAPQCSTAFVLRTASLCSSRTQRSVQERRWSSATATATATALARRMGGTRSPTIAPTAGAKQRVGVATILMMAADPAEEAAKDVAEAASAADEPSIPEGEEVVAAAPEEEEEDAGLMEEEDEDGEAQTEVVVEGEEEAKEQEEEEVDPMAEVRQQIEVGFVLALYDDMILRVHTKGVLLLLLFSVRVSARPVQQCTFDSGWVQSQTTLSKGHRCRMAERIVEWVGCYEIPAAFAAKHN